MFLCNWYANIFLQSSGSCEFVLQCSGSNTVWSCSAMFRITFLLTRFCKVQDQILYESVLQSLGSNELGLFCKVFLLVIICGHDIFVGLLKSAKSPKISCPHKQTKKGFKYSIPFLVLFSLCSRVLYNMSRTLCLSVPLPKHNICHGPFATVSSLYSRSIEQKPA